MVCIYTILNIYVIKHNGRRESLRNIKLLFTLFYVPFLILGIFIFSGLSFAYSVAFQGEIVYGMSKVFAIICGLLFAFFPFYIIMSLIKIVAYDVLMTCVQKYD